ncbi:MAG: hypothetical protein JWP18_815, partial [Solirubrobacterales bacterium]|nr:hypothetical protein [Solirubrobacterales bacterium]
ARPRREDGGAVLEAWGVGAAAQDGLRAAGALG